MPPASSLVPTAPDWKFTVEAVKASNGTLVVGVLVAPGIPIAALTPTRARKIAKALNAAANSIDNDDDEFPGIGDGTGLIL